MDNPRIVLLEWAELTAERPRSAGSNARRGVHGAQVRVPIARLTAEDGTTGWGLSFADPCAAAPTVLGRRLDELFDAGSGVAAGSRAFEAALWDLVGRRAGRPVHALAARINGKPEVQALRVRCYDTSLYFDDLHLASHAQAAALLAQEAHEGYARGHRAWKLKVGRGARYMAPDVGLARDIAVIRGVRDAVGPGLPLLIDANNGYTLNLARHVLAETADCGVYWIEEAFHEDGELYAELQRWLRERGLGVLIADGEGDAGPRLLEWARAGIVDVVQYDIWSYGFTAWLALGKALDASGARSAPHHYGTCLGNFVACHLAPAIGGFTFAEWDEAVLPGVDTSGYRVVDGSVHLPDAPGWGLALDDERFQHLLARAGFRARL